MRRAAMQNSDHPVRRRIFIGGAVLFGTAVGVVALDHFGAEFVIGRSNPQLTGTAPAPPGTGAASSDALKFSFFDQPRALPDLRFVDGEGRSLSLQDFRNKPVLLNIW